MKTIKKRQGAESGNGSHFAARHPSPSRNRPGRPQAADAESMLNRLTAIAFHHFLLYGPDGANIQTIAREAGVTRQTIHSRFGDKKAFFDGIMRNRDAGFFNQFNIHLEDDNRPVRIVLLDLGRKILDYLLLTDRIASARLMFGGLHQFPSLAKAERAAHDRTNKVIADYLQNVAVGQGTSLRNPRTAARNFVAMLHGIVEPVIMGMGSVPSRREREDELTDIVDLFLKGSGLTAGKGGKAAKKTAKRR